MADSELENSIGFADNRKISGSLGLPGNLSSTSRYIDVDDLRTRLAAANSAYYTAAMLNTMTKNDMVFAVRSIDDAAGI